MVDSASGRQCDSVITLAVCDDHEMVREALAVVLGSFEDISVVGVAESSATLVDVVQGFDPDVVLVDVRLGQESGLDVARHAKAVSPRLKVIMLTSFAGDQVLVDASELGAVAFLLKSGRPHEIADAVRSVAAGEVLIDGNEVAAARRRLSEAADGR